MEVQELKIGIGITDIVLFFGLEFSPMVILVFGREGVASVFVITLKLLKVADAN